MSLSIWQWLIVGAMIVMIGMFVAIGMVRTKKLDEEAIRSGLKTCPSCTSNALLDTRSRIASGRGQAHCATSHTNQQ
jgi:hypothetical protein